MSESGGTGRFTIESRLGAGGMGVVFAAYDRVRGARVALKRINHFDPEALIRFKNEFRALSDISHPNLVALHELLLVDDEYLFTMELVDDAKDFLSFVRPLDPNLGKQDSSMDTVASKPLSLAALPARAAVEATGGPDLQRLRSGLSQLARGLDALHRAGKLHRDLKPGNILVSPEGRLLICDFGLIQNLSRRAETATAEGGGAHSSDMAGTPSYMSPEQVQGLALSPASDWYSVGVLLYQALTGRTPFTGAPAEILARKVASDPPTPSAVARDVPEDLEFLCMRLLARDPVERCSGAEVLRFLGDDAAPLRSVEAERPLVGREAQLAVLETCFQEAQSAHDTRVVMVHGSSGMGKSALVRHFCAEKETQGALVLSGRCYEHESVPFKAVDGVVDALTTHLAALSPEARVALLPTDLAALVRIFPVMQPLLGGAKREPEGGTSAGQRRRGFEALRALVAAMAEARPLILYVDDLQWGDDDSSALLLDLLAPPRAPAVLFVGTYRTEDQADVPLLKAVQTRTLEKTPIPTVTELALTPLSGEAAATLIRSLNTEGLNADAIAQLAREAAGSPYLLEELAGAREEVMSSLSGEGSRTRLDSLMRSRLAGLPEAVRRLAESVALAGRPVTVEVAAAAAEMGEDTPRALTLLRASRLLRVRNVAGREELVTYHDRIRETARDALSPEARAALHGRLAHAYLAQGQREPEVLYEHWRGAGLLDRALEQAVLAAQKARDSLAFDRAAHFFAIALELGPDSAERLSWRVSQAEALASGGQGHAAGDTYLEAAAQAPDARREELRRRAANEYLRAGLMAQGWAVCAQVLQAHGVKLPGSGRTSLMQIVLRRARLKLRGLDFTIRQPSELPPRVLQRLDALWVTSQGLAFYGGLAAGAVQMRCLLDALDAGEPMRLSRSLAAEAAFLSLSGVRNADAVERLHALVREVIKHTQVTPYLRGTLLFTMGLASYHLGRWKQVNERVEEAARHFRMASSGVSWELGVTSCYSLASLLMQGELKTFQQRLPPTLRAVRDAGDTFGELQVVSRMSAWFHLMDDAPRNAAQELESLQQRCKEHGFLVPSLYRLVSECHVALYEGRPEEVERSCLDAFRQMPALSMMMRTETARAQLRFAQAAASLAVALQQTGRQRQQSLREARRLARQLSREHALHARGLGALLEGRVGLMEGKTEWAISCLERSVRALEMSDMQLHAATARWQLGLAQGGAEGAARVSGARQWMQAQGIRNPERMATAMGAAP